MGKVILVTGGSRGIGAATAQLASQRGYAVCINYREHRAAAAVHRDDLVGVLQDVGESTGKCVHVAEAPAADQSGCLITGGIGGSLMDQ